jgi:hypothetical protein
MLKLRYYILLIILVCILIVLYDIYQDNETVSSIDKNSNPFKKHIEAKNYTSIEDGAYAFLSMGAQSNQLNCAASIESLVRYGGWDGHIYLITDREYCYDKKTLVKNANMDSDKLHIVQINEDLSSGGIDVLHPVIGFRKSRVRSFAMKTRLLEFITDENIKNIAYVDCDIIFGIQGCAKEYITGGPSWNDVSLKFSRVFYNNKNEFEGIHAGTIVLNRLHSEEALKIWRNRIEMGLEEGDNDAYASAYYAIQQELNKSNDTKTKNPLLPGEIIDPNKPDNSNRYEKFLDMEPENLACMSHISKARCTRYGRDTVQKFVNAFDLNTYNHHYSYCVHPNLHTFLYGWFPLRYIPFCPKIETLL